MWVDEIKADNIKILEDTVCNLIFNTNILEDIGS